MAVIECDHRQFTSDARCSVRAGCSVPGVFAARCFRQRALHTWMRVSYLSNAVRGDLDLKHGISIIILTHVVYKQYMDKFLLANPRPKRNDNSLIICTYSVHAESPVHRCFAFLDSIDVCLAVRKSQHRRSWRIAESEIIIAKIRLYFSRLPDATFTG